MINVPFFRAEGCQNTFLIFDLLSKPRLFNELFIEAAHKQLVSEGRDDGLILLPTEKRGIIKMMVLDPDGTFADFCGNGARSVAAYLYSTYNYRAVAIECYDGNRNLYNNKYGSYGVDMLTTLFDPYNAKFVKNAFQYFTAHEVSSSIIFSHMPDVTWYYAQTGEPHLVTTDSITDLELYEMGMYVNHNLRYIFPHGIHFNAAKIFDRENIFVTTFEKGLDRITKACGTGATSTAALFINQGIVNPHLNVGMPGGTITIDYDFKAHNSRMNGPAFVDFNQLDYVVLPGNSLFNNYSKVYSV